MDVTTPVAAELNVAMSLPLVANRVTWAAAGPAAAASRPIARRVARSMVMAFLRWILTAPKGRSLTCHGGAVKDIAGVRRKRCGPGLPASLPAQQLMRRARRPDVLDALVPE